MIQIYNTLTRRKEPLETIRPREVGMYSCGVTVYDLCHVGHARMVIVFDVIQRYLRAKGYRVTFVRNFTDVDDKIIRRANAEGVGASEVSERYIAEFRTDMASIGVEPADIEPKATEHIADMIAVIERLIAKGVAYGVDGDVYFEVQRFPEYGKLSGKKLDELLVGARVEVDERKRDPRDFALWKSSKPGEPSWSSPWGRGRPGWHIECSAMASKYLGETFDIHGGGEDLIFPHHECEIAQSEAVTGTRFARYWLHNGMVNLGAEKMSKSLGNTLTIRDLLTRHDRDALRLYLARPHYRSSVDFLELRIAQAHGALARFGTLIRDVDVEHDREVLDVLASAGAQYRRAGVMLTVDHARQIALGIKESDAALGAEVLASVSGFESAMDDDFNTPQALGALWDLRRSLSLHHYFVKGLKGPDLAFKSAVLVLLGLWRIFGLFEAAQTEEAPVQVNALVQERSQARTERDWQRADRLREEILRLGWLVEDTPAGPRLTPRGI